MRSILAVVLLVAQVSVSEVGARPVRLLDDGTASIFPACSASYSTQCAFVNAYRLVESLSSTLSQSTDVDTVLEQVSNKTYNGEDALHFAPYILETTNMTCVANGRNSSFNGKTMAEIAKTFMSVNTLQTGLEEEIRKAVNESEDGWFKLFLSSEDRPNEPISHYGYAKKILVNATQDEYIILAALAKRSLPRIDTVTCPNGVNRLCSITNARALIGDALSRAMDVTTEEELMEVWTDIAYPTDTSLADGRWYVFALERLTPQTIVGHINLNYIGMAYYTLIKSLQPHLNEEEVLEQELLFEVAGGNGGTWLAYNFSLGSEAVLPKVSYIAGFQRFGVEYILGTGFNHLRDPEVKAAFCTQCEANSNAPCAIGNTQSLVAHAEVGFLINVSKSEAVERLHSGSEYKMAGNFGIILVRYDGNLEADSLLTSSTSLNESLAARYIDEDATDLIHELLKDKANQGGGWIKLPGSPSHPDFVALVRKISKYNEAYYLFTGYADQHPSVTSNCSSHFDDKCAEENTKAVVGQIVTAIQLTTSDAEFQTILDDINSGVNGTLTLPPDFYGILLNEEYEMIAFGGEEERGDWNASIIESYLKFVQQRQYVTSLGNEFPDLLHVAAYEVGGSYLEVEWNRSSDDSSEIRHIFTQVATRTSDSGIDQTYYVLSMFIANPEPAQCNSDNDCPENSFCVLDDHDHDEEHGLYRCACGFYYKAVFAKEVSECTESPVNIYSMTCEIDSSKFKFSRINAFARFLAAFCILLAILCLVWTTRSIRSPVLVASQPFLLYFIIVGAFLSSISIILISIDDYGTVSAGSTGLSEKANMACMTQSWFWGLGFMFMFCSMFIKIRRASRIVKGTQRNLRRIKGISLKNALSSMAVLFSIEIILLATWSIKAPLKLVRFENNPNNASCEHPDASFYFALIFLYHSALMIYGVFLGLKCRNVNGLYDEVKYLNLGMQSYLQVNVVTCLVLFLVKEDTVSAIFSSATWIFLNTTTTLCFIFTPKMYFSYYSTPTSTSVDVSESGKRTTLRSYKGSYIESVH